MRTTIELPDHLRARLLSLAAERGEKGYSRLIQEALEQYLGGGADRTQRRREALASLGSIDEEAAETMRATVQRLRTTWR